ncbi:MAG: acyl carrier protein [Ardenticatenaceae bacterium]|nr:acyl carrier protein [Ardenticatenaceae bacterium]MCB9443925.1 acyl carrier protein [Ardenticatenaceae bacterium]
MKIEDKIKQYVAENILFSDDGYPFPDDASFMDEGVIDSLGVLELALFVEENFGFVVSRNDLTPTNFGSVTELAAFIRQHTAVPA